MAAQIRSWRFGTYIWPAVSVISIVAVWQLLVAFGRIPPFLLPAPLNVCRKLASLLLTGDLIRETGLTLYRTSAGFALAVLVGSGLGLAMGTSRLFARTFDPIISILFPTPKISFLPIFILWFGTFDLSKVLIAAFICVFPVISACHDAIKGLDPRLSWVGRNLGMSTTTVFRKIVFPATIPSLINGAEVSLPFAFISIVTAEMMAGGGGIGARMMLAGRFADSTAVFAWLATLAVVGALLTSLAKVIRRRLLQWHTEVG